MRGSVHDVNIRYAYDLAMCKYKSAQFQKPFSDIVWKLFNNLSNSIGNSSSKIAFKKERREYLLYSIRRNFVNFTRRY